ncbi:hypothetical protein N7449_000601 [Penicillium cf. viridicatum]|uniref:DUF3669 domain-containing protein n=1 Tax=Penicillium cf. viridicatum TaxID=2972119 RepID=A0A9W9N558_9EURO|nr:hypothetical protein N7449_000601 [Penicillium cf. viridicatum]
MTTSETQLNNTMTNNISDDTEEADTSTLLTIGQGFCGTVWASEIGPAFKREDGRPHRSLINDFEMHNRVIQSLQKIPTLELQLQIQIPSCYGFIKATDHIDQLEELGITTNDINQYARIMAETLAMMHWIGEIDGNDIEFVLAPPSKGFPLKMESKVLGDHSMWVLDFDLYRRMTMDSKGVEQAAADFWGNDRYYPRPGPERDILLWIVFRNHYLQISEMCTGIVNEPYEAERRRALSRQFIDLVEQKGKTTKEKEQEP